MKKYIIPYLLMACLFTSCYDDMGNYKYHDINEITISGLDASYTVIPGVQVLSIDPVVEMTDADYTDESRFEYTWLAAVNYQSRDTLGKSRVLSTTVNLPPASYYLWLKVYDRQTQLVWKKRATLVVGNPYSKGIMLIGENAAGFAEAQMISMLTDTIVTRDILAGSGLPALRNPIDFLHTGNASDAYTKTWVLTGSGSYYVDRVTQKGTANNTFSRLVYTTDPTPDGLTPVVIGPRIKDRAGVVASTYYRAAICSNGYVFCTSLTTLGDFYVNPINRVSTDMDVLLKAKPFMMYALNAWTGFMWYDEDNERFMTTGTYDMSSSALVDEPGEVFPWNQSNSGRTLVYAENTFNSDGGSTNGNTFALMKDAANNYFIYKFYVGAAREKRAMYEILPLATDFAEASMYAFSSNRTVIYYVAGKLYAYDYNPDNEKGYVFDIFGTDEITMIKADTQIDPTPNPLYVATYNASTGGTLQKYDSGINPNVVELIPDPVSRWSGLTKIKNMSWRAVK